MNQENWLPIPEHPNYEASSLGRIRSFVSRYGVRKTPLVMNINGSGKYLRVTLRSGGASKTFLVHRLIALTFIPNPLNLPQVNHINGQKLDNRIENLEWVSIQENHDHAVRNGLKARGDSVNTSKLNSEIILEIRAMYSNGSTLKQIGSKFGIHFGHVSKIVRRECWTHV